MHIHLWLVMSCYVAAESQNQLWNLKFAFMQLNFSYLFLLLSFFLNVNTTTQADKGGGYQFFATNYWALIFQQYEKLWTYSIALNIFKVVQLVWVKIVHWFHEKQLHLQYSSPI